MLRLPFCFGAMAGERKWCSTNYESETYERIPRVSGDGPSGGRQWAMTNAISATVTDRPCPKVRSVESKLA